MGERLTVTSLEDGVEAKIEVLERTPFNMGTETKFFLRCLFDGNEVSYIERKNPFAYIAAWNLLRSAGMPVVSSIWKVDQSTLIVEDIKADSDIEIYGKGMKIALLYSEYNRFRPRYHIDPIFEDLIEGSGFRDIRECAFDIAETATKHGITLPKDDPMELKVWIDGSWDLVMLDLNQAKQNRTDIYGSREDKAGFFNIRGVNNFLANLRDVAGALATASDAEDSWFINFGL